MTQHEREDFKAKYGPYALIAGGSEGLGAAYAEGLAKRGLNLVLLARKKDALETFGKVLRAQYAVDVICLPADMGDYETVKDLVTALADSAASNVQIGLLVYNAAYCPIGLFAETSDERLAQAVAVNVKGPLLLTKLVSQKMIENKRGGIVLMSSLAGTQGSPKLATYAATKSFNAILAEGLWQELKPQGIDVIACIAGAISTPAYLAAQQAKAPGTLTAAEVAETALKALGKYPIVVPGAVNKIARFVMARLLPRSLAIKLMSANTGSLE